MNDLVCDAIRAKSGEQNGAVGCVNFSILKQKVAKDMLAGCLSVKDKEVLKGLAMLVNSTGGWISAGALIDALCCARNTVYSRMPVFVELGIVIPHGATTCRVYMLSPEYGGPDPAPKRPPVGAEATEIEVHKAIIQIQQQGRHPFVAEIAAVTGRKKGTISTHLRSLCAAQKVWKFGQTNATYYVARVDENGTKLADPDLREVKPGMRRDGKPGWLLGLTATVQSILIRRTMNGQDSVFRDFGYLRKISSKQVQRCLARLVESGHAKEVRKGVYRAALMQNGEPIEDHMPETYIENGIRITRCPPSDLVGYLPIEGNNIRAGIEAE